ncbi:nuclear transport factor 2 family protein [Nonomuraea sp. LPB2021202275-12-8]|uniref:nuclear transport factor 2 family protein n=1 Tax=Nonomuraea sp. LPB2021202275-12-8 TaxID=3120159 RepID=UPI00300C2508
MSMIFLRRGFLLAAIVPALLTAGCAAGGNGQAMKGAASPASPTSDMETGMETDMQTDMQTDMESPTDTASPSPGDTSTGGAGQGSPRGVIEKFYTALAAGNADQAVQAFTSDAVVAVEGEATAEGTQALKTLFQGQEDQAAGTPTIDETTTMGKAAFVRATAGQGGDQTRAFFLLTKDNGDWKIDRFMSNSPS